MGVRPQPKKGIGRADWLGLIVIAGKEEEPQLQLKY